MYMISKQFRFDASHRLLGLPPDHKCGRLHGHSYAVELILQRMSLDECGFVVDYGDLAPFKEYIDNSLDHRDLNEVLGFQTTAENIAKHLHHIASDLFQGVVIVVRVAETSNTWASYSGEDA
jgi:6-pyruvoyltetrahydropterin/6-carboxytetrahydropterin synthase